jgi:hypothetical protein
VNRTRGYHRCELCPPSESSADGHTQAPCEAGAYPLGDAEIRVRGKDGQVFAAPNLIAHYVAQHSYKPPESFALAAIRAAADTVGC